VAGTLAAVSNTALETEGPAHTVLC
jgi:hypothetical protein